jgi:hypothetical protein
MKFDHSKLIGRIIEKFGTRAEFVKHIGWTDSKLSTRLNNQVQFDADEIIVLCQTLDIPTNEIGTYFFSL